SRHHSSSPVKLTPGAAAPGSPLYVDCIVTSPSMARAVKTRLVFFPFDLFGSSGAGDGARLLADAVREMLADNRRERLPTRAEAYQDAVRVRELPFDTLAHFQEWRQRGRRAVQSARKNGDFLFWITGNHLGTLP